MKVSALNKNIYSNININYASVPIQKKPAERPMEGATALYSYNPAYLTCFTGNNTRKTSPFYKKTIDTIDRTYDKYYQSQMITEKEDIQAAVDEIMAETGESEEYVLNAMSQVTQFANYRSIKKIGDALNSEHVNGRNIYGGEEVILYGGEGVIPNHLDAGDESKTYAEKSIMLATALKYLLYKKDLCSFDRGCCNKAIFLDEDQLNYLEELYSKRPQDIEAVTDDSDVKFFVISGFENGINFLNRSKDLKTATIDLINKAKDNNSTLEEAVDIDLIERAKRLGINPIVIKNKPDLTVEGIYENMKPEMMSRDDLLYIVDVNSELRLYDAEREKSLEAKDKTADYLERKLEVFSPERLSCSLLDLHDKIVDYAMSKGKTEDDIYYYVPDNVKSIGLINYMYKKVNGVPIDKFVMDSDLIIRSRTSFKEGDILVALDDCTMSGDSVCSRNIKLRKNKDAQLYDRVFACVYGTQIAKDVIKNQMQKPLFLAVEGKDTKDDNDWLNLTYIVGDAGYDDSASCCVFPYMSPDNNSELASSIALLHNIMYRTEKDPDKRRNISTSTICNRTDLSTNVADRVSTDDNNGRRKIKIVKPFAIINNLNNKINNIF